MLGKHFTDSVTSQASTYILLRLLFFFKTCLRPSPTLLFSCYLLILIICIAFHVSFKIFIFIKVIDSACTSVLCTCVLCTCMCVHVCLCVCSIACVYGSQRTTYSSHFFLFTTEALGIELRSLHLVTGLAPLLTEPSHLSPLFTCFLKNKYT